MSKFEVDDIVVKNGVPGRDVGYHRRVVAVHHFPSTVEKVWITDMHGTDFGIVISSTYSKVEPKFEVGNAYRRVSDPLKTAVVVSSSDRAAIGWTATGEIWSMLQRFRSDWEEIGVSIAADIHKNLCEMGIAL